jgi:hypothetical protein
MAVSLDTPLSARVHDRGGAFTHVSGFAAVGDGKQATGGAMTSASAVLTTTAGTAFTAAHVGKEIRVPGAGAAGAELVTTISAYTSATQVTLTVAASTTVASKTITWGTNDTVAIATAAAAATALGSTTLVFNHGVTGKYMVDSTLSLSGFTLVGDGSPSFLGVADTISNWNTSSSTNAITIRSQAWSAVAPTLNQVPVWDGSQWVPGATASSASITQGGGTASINGSGAISLAPAAGQGVSAPTNGVADTVSIGPATASAQFTSAVGKIATATGSAASSFGYNARAQVASGTAIGANALASTASGATALGADCTASATNALAIGKSATASASSSIAIGSSAAAASASGISIGTSTSSGVDAVAIGASANGNQTNATIVGKSGSATGANSVGVGKSCVAASECVAIGSGASTTANQNVCVGMTSSVSAASCVVIGHTASSASSKSIVIGRDASSISTETETVVIGYQAKAYTDATIPSTGGGQNVAIGAYAEAGCYRGTAIGWKAKAWEVSATAIGRGALATGSHSVAIGRGAWANVDNTISIGFSGANAASHIYFESGHTHKYVDLDGSTITRVPASTPIVLHGFDAYDATASVSNVAGGPLQLAGGAPTGSGTAGTVDVQTAGAGAGGNVKGTLVTVAQFDHSSTAGDTRMLLWDVTAGSLKRVSIGAADSGGTGFKLLRVAN